MTALAGRLRALKTEALTLWCAAHHPRMPWGVRMLAMAVAAYAFSPIDLIPDVIPVLGLLDDLILVPLGVWLVLRLSPPDVLQEARAQALTLTARPVSRTAAVVIALVWLSLTGGLFWLVWWRLHHPH